MTWDPLEGVGPDGVVTTGVGRQPIAPPFDAVLAEASARLVACLGHTLHGLYVYGSVATGQARAPRSDLDLYAVTRQPAAAACREVAEALSGQWKATVRGVGITSVPLADVRADDLAGQAERCFIRHYCLGEVAAGITTAAPELASHVARARAWTDLEVSRRPTPDTDDVVAAFGALRDWLAHAYAGAADGRGVDPH